MVNRQHFRLRSFASLFSGFLQFNDNFVHAQNNWLYRGSCSFKLSILKTNTKTYKVSEFVFPFFFLANVKAYSFR